MSNYLKHKAGSSASEVLSLSFWGNTYTVCNGHVFEWLALHGPWAK